MVYTVVLKKVLNNRVNEGMGNNLSVHTFFAKYPFLRSWFSMRLMEKEWSRMFSSSDCYFCRGGKH